MSSENSDWFNNLQQEEHNFIKKFLLASGSLKELASNYNVTYPTVRLRLDRLIEKIKISDKELTHSYINTIKNLAIDEKISLEVAKLLIYEYKRNKED